VLGARNALARSPANLASQIKVPVFLAAGGKDERAPIEYTKRMERALKAAGVPVESLYFPTRAMGSTPSRTTASTTRARWRF
jgi:dipeptidyl aminopeptidase/acylaminoacyl peptidase